MSSRQFILHQLKSDNNKTNLSNSRHLDAEPHSLTKAELLPLFTSAFKHLGGQLYHSTINDLEQQIQTIIDENGWQTGISSGTFSWQSLPISTYDQIGYDPAFSITPCTALIASTGSVLIESNSEQSRLASVSCQHHIIIANQSQLVYSIHQAMEKVNSSMCCIISGHSKTADIEKKLVDGAHGPKKVILILIA